MYVVLNIEKGLEGAGWVYGRSISHHDRTTCGYWIWDYKNEKTSSKHFVLTCDVRPGPCLCELADGFSNWLSCFSCTYKCMPVIFTIRFFKVEPEFGVICKAVWVEDPWFYKYCTALPLPLILKELLKSCAFIKLFKAFISHLYNTFCTLISSIYIINNELWNWNNKFNRHRYGTPSKHRRTYLHECSTGVRNLFLSL